MPQSQAATSAVPLDPQSDAGLAAAEALTEVLASIEVSVNQRRRARAPRRRTGKAA
jgi:hypothetical protein